MTKVQLPGWAWKMVVGLILLLLGIVTWFLQTGYAEMQARFDSLDNKIGAVHANVDTLSADVRHMMLLDSIIITDSRDYEQRLRALEGR